jgi:very-short-patch-repair endonuclease
MQAEVGLGVEVDGVSHAGRGRADARRDNVLERAGYRVLRVDARSVAEAPRVAVERVRDAIEGMRGGWG